MMKSIQTVINLIDKASGATICYVDAEGYPNARAMLSPRFHDGAKEFLFTTNTSSRKVACLRRDPKASIYFVDKRFFRGVCLLGRAEILETPAAKERIWQDGDERYYPGGVTDPDYCVIRFIAEKGRYYADFHSEDFVVE